MTSSEKENTQCIIQGKCTECGSYQENYTVLDKEHKNSSIVFKICCQCGEESTVSITNDGITHSSSVSYESASWTGNVEDDNDEESGDHLDQENEHIH